MTIETLRQDGLTLDAELLDELADNSEALASDAPLPCPDGLAGGLILLGLSPKEPKEPSEPRRR